ncbi:hypothetical protein [Saccharopolyspora sp. NPDC050642]|uniref:hypothetical protein n=1 Tax=Saccharopolyspora sp. NPDC050642 TaxID=3157099 RepID=UPI0033E6008A
MSLWDLFRRRRGGARREDGSAQPATTTPGWDGGWRRTAADPGVIQRAGIGVTAAMRFRESVTSFQDHGVMTGLGHSLQAGAPSGLVHGLLRPAVGVPVQRSAAEALPVVVPAYDGDPVPLDHSPASVAPVESPVAEGTAAPVRPRRLSPPLTVARLATPLAPRPLGTVGPRPTVAPDPSSIVDEIHPGDVAPEPVVQRQVSPAKPDAAVRSGPGEPLRALPPSAVVFPDADRSPDQASEAGSALPLASTDPAPSRTGEHRAVQRVTKTSARDTPGSQSPPRARPRLGIGAPIAQIPPSATTSAEDRPTPAEPASPPVDSPVVQRKPAVGVTGAEAPASPESGSPTTVRPDSADPVEAQRITPTSQPRNAPGEADPVLQRLAAPPEPEARNAHSPTSGSEAPVDVHSPTELVVPRSTRDAAPTNPGHDEDAPVAPLIHESAAVQRIENPLSAPPGHPLPAAHGVSEPEQDGTEAVRHQKTPDFRQNQEAPNFRQNRTAPNPGLPVGDVEAVPGPDLVPVVQRSARSQHQGSSTTTPEAENLTARLHPPESDAPTALPLTGASPAQGSAADVQSQVRAPESSPPNRATRARALPHEPVQRVLPLLSARPLTARIGQDPGVGAARSPQQPARPVAPVRWNQADPAPSSGITPPRPAPSTPVQRARVSAAPPASSAPVQLSPLPTPPGGEALPRAAVIHQAAETPHQAREVLPVSRPATPTVQRSSAAPVEQPAERQQAAAPKPVAASSPIPGVPAGVPVTVVQRKPEPAATGEQDAAPAGAGGSGGQDIDELARRLIEPVGRLLRAEFRHGRERIGRLHDRRR